MLSLVTTILAGSTTPSTVYCLSVVHLCVCIYFVATASSVETYELMGVKISPLLQCLNAGWFLLGIPATVLAFVGTLMRLETQLAAYFWYLCGTGCVGVAWFIIFICFGGTCVTTGPQVLGQYRGPTFHCYTSDILMIIIVGVLELILLVVTFQVWVLKETFSKKWDADIMRCLQPYEVSAALAEEHALEAQRVRQQVASFHKPPGGCIATTGPAQPGMNVSAQAWKSVPMPGPGATPATYPVASTPLLAGTPGTVPASSGLAAAPGTAPGSGLLATAGERPLPTRSSLPERRNAY